MFSEEPTEMFLKIIATVSLLAACYADSPQQLSNSNQAISSQSFVRQDIPISYQYNAVHVYTTSKPEQSDKDNDVPSLYHPQMNLKQKEIQYAPLLRPGEVPSQNSLYTNINIPNLYYTERSPTQENSKTYVEKNHLEPKLTDEKQLVVNSQSLPYVPGHNIEVLQSVNRSPGHNAVYRSYPERKPDNSGQAKLSYERPFNVMSRPELESLTAGEKPNIGPKIPVVAQNQVHSVQPHTYHADYINALGIIPDTNNYSQARLFAPHLKTHKLLLNLARAYSIAKLPSNNIRLEKNQFPILSDAFIAMKSAQLHGSEGNTQLRPVEEKHIKFTLLRGS